MTMKLREIRIEGNVAFVPLTRGKPAMIDADDVGLVSGRNWNAALSGNTVYAVRSVQSGNQKRVVRMHRLILNAASHVEVDHINGDGLDNRRRNLRVATKAENIRNSRLRSDNTSGCRGVSWNEETKKWVARIMADGKSHYLGHHESAETAAEAYRAASVRLHGDFGRPIVA